MRTCPFRLILGLALLLALPGCTAVSPSKGGGQIEATTGRQVNPADIILPQGYRIEAVATGLTFPTDVAFDDEGTLYVLEAGYCYGEVWTTPRLLRVAPGGATSVVASGERDRAPWTGVDARGRNFYVAEGGQLAGGRILRVAHTGGTEVLVDNLPSVGDHHTNAPRVSPDGRWLYFGQGTATNSGVVGEDNAKFGWLVRHPDFRDIPYRDVRLTGQNFTTPNVLTDDPDDRATTGAFSPFGTPTREGQVIPGAVPCTGAIFRIPLAGVGEGLNHRGPEGTEGTEAAPTLERVTARSKPDQPITSTLPRFAGLVLPNGVGRQARLRALCVSVVQSLLFADPKPGERAEGDGTSAQLEVVAWGLRNPYGLAFAPDGRLYATENSYDDRGSRPVWGTGDVLWRIDPNRPGLWYGWPDFHAGEPLSWSDHYEPPGEAAPKFLLAEHPNPPPKPVAKLGVHSASNGIDFARDESFGHAGEAFIAQFGDMAPSVGKVLGPVGYKVVRVNPRTGVIQDFAANRGKRNGPASFLKTGGLERPTGLRFSPDGSALYVVDFGVMTVTDKGPQPQQGTGVVWRITREGGQ